MAETTVDRGMYDNEELKNIARILQDCGLGRGANEMESTGETKTHEPTPKLPRHGHFLKVSGTSMTPAINDGDTVLWVEVENKAELKVGDIIIFKHPVGDGYLAHRIVCKMEVKAKGKYLFLTKGDKHVPDKEGRRYLDRYATPGENVLGLVIGVLYNLTRWGSAKDEETR
jgi:signal peptidase I